MNGKINNLEIDWDFVPETDKRFQGRINMKELNRLISLLDVNCTILSGGNNFPGTIRDISASGIGVNIFHPFSYFKEREEVKIKFNIDKKFFTIRGKIARIDLNNLGIGFIALKETDKEYLKSLFLSYALQYKTRG